MSTLYIGNSLLFVLLASLTSHISLHVDGLASTPQRIATKQKFETASSKESLVYIDVENVRGKSNFALSHSDLISSTSIWAQAYNLTGHVSLLVDHGSIPSGHYLPQHGLSLIFAGTSMKADDVIVRDVKFCQEVLNRDLIVITQDTELIKRCQRAAERGGFKNGHKVGKELKIVKPIFFLQDLEHVVESTLKGELEHLDDVENSSDEDEGLKKNENMTPEMEHEITMQSKLIAVQTQLKILRKRNGSLKKRHKLEKQANKIRAQLARSGSSSVVKSVAEMKPSEQQLQDFQLLITPNKDFNPYHKKKLLQMWQSMGHKNMGRKELTGERVIMAEGLRLQLENITCSVYPLKEKETSIPVEAHVRYANALINTVPVEEERRWRIRERRNENLAPILNAGSYVPKPIVLEKTTLRLVVISDTHGYERSFTTTELEPWMLTKDDERTSRNNVKTKLDTENSEESNLPNGDILLHLGDFAVDKGGTARRNAVERFDRWLSRQPHSVKIIVRGNHDPHHANFPISGASYVTEPTSLTFGKQVMALIPYGHGGFNAPKAHRHNLLPSTCDILATHEPPRNILDRCLSGECAGSGGIRKAVEKMKGLPPKLWLCGHIHEGRGALRTTFGTKSDTRETLVVNAANANHGRADHLLYGPVVLDVSDESNNVGDESVPQPAARVRQLIAEKIEKNENEVELLLAIDLGLRCGASLFDDSGKLIRYEQLRFEDIDDLYEKAPLLIESWEKDANSNVSNDIDSGKKFVMSYLAVEGGGELFDAWEFSLEEDDKRHIKLVQVRPEEWRSHVLTDKEQVSGRSCKEAARMIARQVVSEYGTMSAHKGKFKTDAAESVVMGYYLSSRFGWIDRQPIVDRYQNGNIIVPK